MPSCAAAAVKEPDCAVATKARSWSMRSMFYME